MGKPVKVKPQPMAAIPGYHMDLMKRVSEIEHNMAGKDQVEVRIDGDDFLRLGKMAALQADQRARPAGTPIGASPPPTPIPPVASLLQDFFSRQEETHKLIEILRSRLEPVLRPPGPSEANGPAAPECCLLADKVRAQIVQQAFINNALNDLLDRLAI